MRVCDALLFRRGLPLYPVPAAGQSPQGWEQWIGVGFELFAALAGLGLLPAASARTGWIEPVGAAALRFGRALRDLPGRDLLRRCSATGRRRSARRGACSSGSRRCGMKGVHDADGGLWHRTLDELDACAAAYAAYALAAGLGLWVGAPEEGVIVLPVAELLDRYEKLPPPARSGARLSDGPTLDVVEKDPLRPHGPVPLRPAAAAGARQAARVSSSARCPRATSPSSRSCCAPPASPSSAS